MRLSTSRRVSEVVGSSMMTSLARVAMARAMATSWRTASGSSPTTVFKNSSVLGKLTDFNARCAVLLIKLRSKRRPSAPPPSTSCSDSATFSATVKLGISDRSW